MGTRMKDVLGVSFSDGGGKGRKRVDLRDERRFIWVRLRWRGNMIRGRVLLFKRGMRVC